MNKLITSPRADEIRENIESFSEAVRDYLSFCKKRPDRDEGFDFYAKEASDHSLILSNASATLLEEAILLTQSFKEKGY